MECDYSVCTYSSNEMEDLARIFTDRTSSAMTGTNIASATYNDKKFSIADYMFLDELNKVPPEVQKAVKVQEKSYLEQYSEMFSKSLGEAVLRGGTLFDASVTSQASVAEKPKPAYGFSLKGTELPKQLESPVLKSQVVGNMCDTHDDSRSECNGVSASTANTTTAKTIERPLVKQAPKGRVFSSFDSGLSRKTLALTSQPGELAKMFGALD
jgi:hypothetical protein